MSNSINYNTITTPLIFAYSDKHSVAQRKFDIDRRIYTSKTHPNSLPFLELFAREMVSNCAVKIHIPNHFEYNEHIKPKKISKLLPPSLRGIFNFVDRDLLIWKGICNYLEPIY